MEHILFLTGRLAEKSLIRMMESIQAEEFSYEIHNLPITVAALMTTEKILRRLDNTRNADRIIVPGFCIGDIEEASLKLGVPVERGPKDLKDLPVFFGRGPQPADLSQYDARIFAEIVDAPNLSVEKILEAAAAYRADGADVIDVGCLPDTDFPHLEDSVKALVDNGYTVSVDSIDPHQLLKGAHAGAQYLLSLKESTLWVASEVEATPILIPEQPEEMASLYRSIDILLDQGKSFIADSIIDPIHFGFVRSIVRYQELRKAYPDIEIMMGIGNLSELTEVDTGGINTIMLGMMSELRIGNLLTTQVSPHAKRSVAELDLGRRIMFRSREDISFPKGYHTGLMSLHERDPFPNSYEEVKELSEQIKDSNFRIQVTADGVHIFNGDGLFTGTDPYELFKNLSSLNDNAPHAYYIGLELGRAQIAWQLGKRYTQDEELDWGCAYRSEDDNNHGPRLHHKEEKSTMQARKKQRRENRAKNTKQGCDDTTSE